MDTNFTLINDLCFTVNHFPTITVWGHTFVSREFLLGPVEEQFVRLVSIDCSWCCVPVCQVVYSLQPSVLLRYIVLLKPCISSELVVLSTFQSLCACNIMCQFSD